MCAQNKGKWRRSFENCDVWSGSVNVVRRYRILMNEPMKVSAWLQLGQCENGETG